MKQAKTLTGRALIVFTLLAPIALTTQQARAGEPIQCGGEYGWWSGEPFYDAAGIWSITVTAFCEDGSVEPITGPVDASGTGLGYVTEAENITSGFLEPEYDIE